MGKVTERIRIAPWTGTGSQESAFRSLEEQNLLFHFIRIWTLPDPQYEQWQKISFAKFIFEGQTYQLKNGISRFVRREDDHYVWWAITILPELFLEYKGNLYALAAVDYRQVHSGDACISCFCKLGRDGTLHTIRRFQEKHLTAMKVTEKGIVFYKWGEYPIEAIPFSEL